MPDKPSSSIEVVWSAVIIFGFLWFLALLVFNNFWIAIVIASVIVMFGLPKAIVDDNNKDKGYRG